VTLKVEEFTRCFGLKFYPLVARENGRLIGSLSSWRISMQKILKKYVN
jgi:hypothetical protein